jgi:hypothetical protein
MLPVPWQMKIAALAVADPQTEATTLAQKALARLP